MEYISSLLESLMGSEDASYCIVGCGLPGRGMGWFHGLQLVNGDIGKAKLTDVVEPWFLGGGKDSDAGKVFAAECVDSWSPDVAFQAGLSTSTWSGAAPGEPKLALIAGRTVDNPGFFQQALDSGATHILLEKPGAPTVGELESMAATAEKADVPVFMGFIKNISAYLEGALAVLRRVKAVRDAPLRSCLDEAFALPEGSAVAEEARLQGLTSSTPGPDLNPFVKPKALSSKEGLLLVHFSGAGGSSVVSWAQSKLDLERHAHSSGNANWGPQSRNDGWVSQIGRASCRERV